MKILTPLLWLGLACPPLVARPLWGQAPAPTGTSSSLPASPSPATTDQEAKPAQSKPLQVRPGPQSPEDQAEALRISKLARINGVPYDQPSAHDTFIAYVKDTYGLTGLIQTAFRGTYTEIQQKPTPWDAADRYGTSAAITVINGNVRYGFEVLFREDLRYLPCNGCSVRKKIENSLLAEITARHDADGHRFFTLTPFIADYSGPILAHELWYPGELSGPLPGFKSARTVFLSRIGTHVATEFFLDPTRKAKAEDRAERKREKAIAPKTP